MVKSLPANAGDVGSIPMSGRFPWRRKWQPTPVVLLGKSHRQRSLVGYSPRGRRVRHDLATTQQQFIKSLRMFMFSGPEIALVGIYLVTSLFQDSPAPGSVGLFSSGSPSLSPFLVFFKALPPAEMTGWNCQKVTPMIAGIFLICRPLPRPPRD